MNRIYILLFTCFLQSCVASYTNRRSFSLSDTNEEAPITSYFYLTKKTMDFPLPSVWYFGDKGDYSLTFQLSDEGRKYTNFQVQDLKIYSEGKLVYASSDSSIFSRDKTFIEGEEVYTFVYKTGYNIKIPKKDTEVRLNINFKLIDHNNGGDYFIVERVFKNEHEKGLGPLL